MKCGKMKNYQPLIFTLTFPFQAYSHFLIQNCCPMVIQVSDVNSLAHPPPRPLPPPKKFLSRGTKYD